MLALLRKIVKLFRRRRPKPASPIRPSELPWPIYWRPTPWLELCMLLKSDGWSIGTFLVTRECEPWARSDN